MLGINKKEKKESKPVQAPPQVAPQETEEVPQTGNEEVEDDEEVETPGAESQGENRPLTAEELQQSIASILYRLGRIEHHLRLDY